MFFLNLTDFNKLSMGTGKNVNDFFKVMNNLSSSNQIKYLFITQMFWYKIVILKGLQV